MGEVRGKEVKEKGYEDATESIQKSCTCRFETRTIIPVLVDRLGSTKVCREEV